ncbi:hypothetical protein [Dyadobacter jiangsuensis]|uniref:Uncharacterized protein n=1 Tax=Dyadobacter jiangsuensis TaxID=1591085 RepID=A0A2P8FND2_9BACT|nr:hypothetical protein [Dyadobacter jiangsuensis]PSL23231.1 hypothetical protein CLV60_117108 [Dyadobacter jiangsuensis]
MPARQAAPATYPKSKAIATITTALSAEIFRIPDGTLKETLLVTVGLLAYFVYHSFVILKRFVFQEVIHWVSLAITERKVQKYIRILEMEYRDPETSSERLAEIKVEMKRYRNQLAQKRLESLT